MTGAGVSRDALVDELVLAHAILCHEDVLDTFGHVSVRDPQDPTRYLIHRAGAPNRVSREGIVTLDLASRPTGHARSDVPLYSERFIHGCIYAARADVMAVCHHHPAALLPYCATGQAPEPVCQAGAAAGPYAHWDSRDEFGDTNLLVDDQARGASLARALGDRQVVLMRRHGVTAVAASLREVVYRAVSVCQNAQAHAAARALGGVAPLSPGEEGAMIPGIPRQSERAWSFWTARLSAGSDG